MAASSACAENPHDLQERIDGAGVVELDADIAPGEHVTRARRRGRSGHQLHQSQPTLVGTPPPKVHPPGLQRAGVYAVSVGPLDVAPASTPRRAQTPVRVRLISNLPPRHLEPPRGPHSPRGDPLRHPAVADGSRRGGMPRSELHIRTAVCLTHVGRGGSTTSKQRLSQSC